MPVYICLLPERHKISSIESFSDDIYEFIDSYNDLITVTSVNNDIQAKKNEGQAFAPL